MQGFRNIHFFVFALLALVGCFSVGNLQAQTSSFTYQGRLSDGGVPANGMYDLQFKLFDAASGGMQQGGTVLRDDVPVTGGAFSVVLDFGAPVFSGTNRWLEVSLRPGASTGAYTTLSPLQPITSTPYAIKSLNAATADGLSVGCANCVTSVQIANGTIVDANVSPSAAINPNKIAGTAATLGANTFTGTQSITGGNISLPATTATAGVITLGGSSFLHKFGSANTFVGENAGNFTMTGFNNGGFGAGALGSLTTACCNNAVGFAALGANTTGTSNNALGGLSLTSNTMGNHNTSVGRAALSDNTTGSNNTAVGSSAGDTANGANANTTGSNNTFIGFQAGPGTSTQLNNATAIGSNALVSANNALVLGDSAVNVGIRTATPNRELEVNGGIRLNTTAARPACDATVRGTFWVSQGASGVQDSVQVCAKDATDSYGWRIIY